MRISQTSLSALGLNWVEQHLYSTLIALGPSSVAAVTRRAGIQRTSAYYMLEKLEKLGLVHITVRRGKRPEYYAEKPEALLRLYDDRVSALAQERKTVKAFTSELSKQYALTAVTPKVQFDRGVAGIKRVMGAAMSGQNKEVLNIMPLDTMLGIVGVDWWGSLMRAQIKNQVRVRVLRVAEHMKRQSEVRRVDPDLNNQWRERRILPKSLAFTITLWIYDDTISFFSSERELFAMTIQSKELTDMQRMNFEYFWSIARPLEK